MAEVEKASKADNEKEQVEEEKWVTYYSSLHEILLVGEGDFSFSTCLAQSFGSASNIVASSIDSYDDVIKKYKKAELNFSILDKFGASHLHGVDATTMKFHSDLKMRKFDRIIYNFPHAGFHGKEDDARLIRMHKRLLDGFFKNACGMLRPDGEVHVNHKTSFPYSLWNLEELASKNSLRLIERIAFKKEDYLGYENKRGSGKRCDDCFLLGECCTFKFSFSRNAEATKVKQIVKRSRKLAKAPTFAPQQPNPFEFRHPSPLNLPCGRSLENVQTPTHAFQQGNYPEYRQPREILQAPVSAYQQGNYLKYRQPRELLQAPISGFQPRNYLTFRQPPSIFDLRMSSIPKCMRSLHTDRIYLECSWIFGPYFERVVQALETPDHNSTYILEEDLLFGYERYMAEDTRRTWSDYTYILHELRGYLVRRSEVQVSRHLTMEYDFASTSGSGHLR